jgi:hypothetical protein
MALRLAGVTSLSFAAVGIPHSAGQRPLTFLVISCLEAIATCGSASWMINCSGCCGDIPSGTRMARRRLDSVFCQSVQAQGALGRRHGPARLRQQRAKDIALLQSPTGATIEAMMKATGWQPHSVRGFLAGVVRKRLKLKLGSKTVAGNRVYPSRLWC